jgi:hypothetical protein
MNMKNVPIICNFIGISLVMAFLIKCIIDYTQYSSITNSAPFYVWILTNALYFLVPAVIMFVFGKYLRKSIRDTFPKRDKTN